MQTEHGGYYDGLQAEVQPAEHWEDELGDEFDRYAELPEA